MLTWTTSPPRRTSTGPLLVQTLAIAGLLIAAFQAFG